MPKFPTYPQTFDNSLQINITKLKKWNYLQPNTEYRGVITWSKRGETTAEISIYANTKGVRYYIELDYLYKGEPRNYKVYLTSTPTNLKKGIMYFFICPHTGKKCRKLYSIGGYFLHRTAFKNVFYSKQIESKFYRSLEKNYGAYFDIDNMYEKIYSKHFRTHYNGKETKQYKKIKKVIEQGKKIQYREIELLYMGLKKP